MTPKQICDVMPLHTPMTAAEIASAINGRIYSAMMIRNHMHPLQRAGVVTYSPPTQYRYGLWTRVLDLPSEPGPVRNASVTLKPAPWEMGE